MPIPEDNLVPEDVTGELEALAQGDGPFTGPLEDAEQKRLERLETSLAEEIDPTEADRLDRERLQILERLDALERVLPPRQLVVDDSELLPDQNVELGKTTGAFTSGATISITPCDQSKVVTGEDAVTVFLRADRRSATAVIANDALLTWERFDTRTDADVAGVLVGGAGTDGFAPGDMIPHASNTVRAGFLRCDGAAVSRITYAALFAEIGTAYGSGNGSTTFNVPDPRGRRLVGSFDGTGVSAGGGAGDLGDTGEYAAVGETGGFAWHGMIENNHPDHYPHIHGISSIAVRIGTGALDANRTSTLSATERTSCCTSMVLRHGGTLHDWTTQSPVFGEHTFLDTDNRSPWWTGMWLIKT